MRGLQFLLLLLGVLPGTGCSKGACMEGFGMDSSGQCRPFKGSSGGDADTGTSALTRLTGDCESPAILPADPLSMDWRVPETDPGFSAPLREFVDVDVDSDLGRAYAVGQGGLVTFEVTAAGGAVLGNYPDNGQGRYYHVEVLGDHIVAVSHRDYGIEILDTTSQPPTRLSQSGAEGASGMAWNSPFLYVLNQLGGLHVFQLNNPVNPVLSTTLDGLGSPWDIEIVGDFAYVADAQLGLVPIDISDGAAPVVGTPVETAGGAQDLTAWEGALHLAVGAAGIQTFDLSDPAAPVSTSTIGFSNGIMSVSADAGLLWGVGHEDVAVLDLSNPTVPIPLGMEPTPQYGMHVKAVGASAYVADWELLERFTVDAALRTPAADHGPGEIYYAQASATRHVTLRNRGSADLEVTGGSIADPRFSAWIDASIISPGKDADIRIDFADDGEPVASSLCIATNDPDDPLRTVLLTEGSGLSSSVATGQEAPDFVLADLDGNSWRLSDNLGHPVVLVYFATW